MDLALSAEQQAVQQEARRFLSAEIGRERRLAWDRTAEGYDPAFWQAVARLGWFGFAEMMVFLAVLMLGFLYIWKKRGLEWE